MELPYLIPLISNLEGMAGPLTIVITPAGTTHMERVVVARGAVEITTAGQDLMLLAAMVVAVVMGEIPRLLPEGSYLVVWVVVVMVMMKLGIPVLTLTEEAVAVELMVYPAVGFTFTLVALFLGPVASMRPVIQAVMAGTVVLLFLTDQG